MIISKTPLRISFVGGGTDFREYYEKGHGAVVSTTIDKYVYVIVKKWFSDDIRVSYSEGEIVKRPEEVRHSHVREILKMTGVDGGVEISYFGDIPIGSLGTGLGASSALTVGLLNALYAHKGERVSAERLAQDAYRVEREILSQPGGKQDQYAAAFGGLNYIQFNADESVTVKPIPLKREIRKLLDKNLLLFYTGMATESARVSAEQKKNTKDKFHFLDEMLQLTKQKYKMLLQNEIHAFGELLHKNWLHKKQLASNISKPVIDEYYEKAMQAGALGGKILGSGGGGFLLFYCPEENQDNVRTALSDLKELPFSFEPRGSRLVRLAQ